MIILYPTETLYALGVNALDKEAVDSLQKLKGRGDDKPPSWLVRNIEDISQYGVVTEAAAKIVERFLPGSLTLILDARDSVPKESLASDGTIGFRISPDPMAEKIISAFMDEYGVPLTCTSANVSGAPTLPTPGEILQQFGEKANLIDEIHDDGARKGLASTVVKVTGSEVQIFREGEISEADIRSVLE